MYESKAEALEEAEKHWAEFLREGWLPGGVLRLASEAGWAEGGATRVAHEKLLEEGWAPGGVYDVMIQKLWAPGGACARMVEDRDSAFWAGLARAQARRAEATEARWAEQRAAHAASGRSGTFVEYKTEFASVWYCNGGFRVHVGVGGGYLNVTYRDLHVAALAADIARIECDRAPLNFPKRAVCLAVPPPPDVLEEMMQTAAGGGSCVRVVLKDSAELVRVRYVVEQTLALEMATDRRAFGRRLVEEARKRGGVVGNDDLYDELAARVDAADYERLLGDRLRAEGLAAPPKDGRVANGKKRGRASSDDPEARAMSNDLAAIRAAYAKEQGLPADKRSRA